MRASSIFALAASALAPARLRVEWLPNPLAVEADKPRLSWRVESETRGQRQSAYRVLVASSEAVLEKDQGDLWDSGKVPGAETLSLVYTGQPLVSGQAAFYRARDVTALLRAGQNTVGAVVADGWHTGYVGYALAMGYGPRRAGRCLYGKTPALLAQLLVEQTDGLVEMALI